MAMASVVVRRILMVGVPIVLGVAAIFYAGNLKKLPNPGATQRQPSLVRVITVEPIDLVPHVTGYGTVAPVREWRAVSRIEGDVTDIAKPLAPGDVVAKGTMLFRIDDSDLKLDMANIDAQLAASKVKDDTIAASLQIAQSDLSIAQGDLARQEKLNRQGVVTATALENSRRQELAARTKLTDLQNQLALNKAERAVLNTQRASLAHAIGFAQIHAPFDLRVTGLSADQGQYVNRGQELLSGEGVAAVDISAQFPLGRIGPLLRMAGDGTKVTDLTARVLLAEPARSVIWKAKVMRMGDAIDERTQSAPVVVRVTDPLAQSKAGERPPLRRNMFVEVELVGPRQKALVVPAEAVQSGMALVVSAQNKLEKRPVQIGFVSGDFAVLNKGLERGDKLVISDPSIAVPGMEVKGVEDEARKAQIAAQALGQPATARQPGSGKGDGQSKEATQ